MPKTISVLLINLGVCGVLLGSYAVNPAFGQVFSLIAAGFVISLLFTSVAWLINHSQMSYREQQNLHLPLYIILNIAIFWLAAVIGDGQIFRLHAIEVGSLFSFVFAGGMWGLMMGWGVLFDKALLLRSSLSWLWLIVSLFGFAMMFVWYSPSRGWLLVLSVIITRITLSIVMNRVFADQIEEHLVMIGFLL